MKGTKMDIVLTGAQLALYVEMMAEHRWLLAIWGAVNTVFMFWLFLGFKWYNEKIEIKSRHDDVVYLTRYFLFGHTLSRYAVMLHCMHRPDDDPCHHDHPWWFITCVLKGGYREEVSRMPEVEGSGWPAWVETVWNKPGRIRYRPATHAHRIAALPGGNCWTLVLRGQKSRSWGFHTDRGWVWWQSFLSKANAGVAWCTDVTKRGVVYGGWEPPKQNSLEKIR